MVDLPLSPTITRKIKSSVLNDADIYDLPLMLGQTCRCQPVRVGWTNVWNNAMDNLIHK